MTGFEYQFPSVRHLPSVTASASSTRLPPTLRRASVRGGPSGRVHRRAPEPITDRKPASDDHTSDLDYLTEDDRELIEAVTGETIEVGQKPADRPISPFAMQLAVDRKNGGLSAGLEVNAAYLQRTNRLLLQLNVPSNPFSGELLDRALTYLDRRTGGHFGR